MSQKNIKAMLNEALENEIPAEDVNLWPSVQADLVAGNHLKNQQGNQMNTQISRRLPRFAFALALFITLLAVFFATPQGRTFAQSLLEFFTQAEDTTFPLEETLVDPLEDVTNAPTAPPPAPLISVAEAETQLGFAIAELPDVPAGFEYLGARLYGSSVSIEYQAIGFGGNLIITQSKQGFSETQWAHVPSDVVSQVKVGELDAAFAQGIFVVYPDTDAATWNPDAAVYRLRWVKDGVYFEMAKFGNVESIEYLDQAGMIILAESLSE